MLCCFKGLEINEFFPFFNGRAKIKQLNSNKQTTFKTF